MPKWGLTEEQVRIEPWGLPSQLLRADKQITDPIHGDIFLSVLETAVLDTSAMQRLRRVRQLGTTHLVYPGATHTRFSHALGTLRAAQNLLDVVLTQGLGRSPVHDLFREWRSASDEEYQRMTGEATVLARLGGLLHDLGHVPFGHTLEDDLRFFDPHDANDARHDFLWDEMANELAQRVDIAPNGVHLPADLSAQLRLIMLSKSGSIIPTTPRYPFVSDIVGNTICADLVDYLQRDHFYTGLPVAVGQRVLNGFYVTPSSHPYQPQRMVVRIKRDGRPRADVVSELFKYLRYRYELSERAFVHHAKLAADVMVGKMMEMWNAALAAETDGEEARREIEQQALRRSDDGLLEHILDQARGHPDNLRWQGLAEIVSQLQRRRLFKEIGVYTHRAMGPELYDRYHSAEARAEVEGDAARYAGVGNDWMVALWLPNPEMRFKPAQVLVDDGGPNEILALEDWASQNGRRGSEIIESHHSLWAMRVYVERSLSERQQQLVLDRMQDRLGVGGWDGHGQ